MFPCSFAPRPAGRQPGWAPRQHLSPSMAARTSLSEAAEPVPREKVPGGGRERGRAATRGAWRFVGRPLPAPAAGVLTAAGPDGAGCWPGGERGPAGAAAGDAAAGVPTRPGCSLRCGAPWVPGAAWRLRGAGGRYPPLSSSGGGGDVLAGEGGPGEEGVRPPAAEAARVHRGGGLGRRALLPVRCRYRGSRRARARARMGARVRVPGCAGERAAGSAWARGAATLGPPVATAAPQDGTKPSTLSPRCQQPSETAFPPISESYGLEP